MLWNSNVLRVPPGTTEINPLAIITRPQGALRIEGTESGGTTSWMEMNVAPAVVVAKQPQSNPEAVQVAPTVAALGVPQSTSILLRELQHQFEFTHREGDAEPITAVGTVSISGGAATIAFDRHDQADKVPSSIILTASARRIDHSVIDRFSRMIRDGEEHALIDVLKLVEPRLRKIEVLTEQGVPRLWADLGGGVVIPADQLGDGLGRLMSVFASLNFCRGGGVTLIDEMENGVHHTALERLWAKLSELTERLDVQVIATTHSRECIEAAYSSFAKTDENGFALHRLYRSGDSVAVESYKGEKVRAALDLGLEVR